MGFQTLSIVTAPNSGQIANYCGLITHCWALLGWGWPEEWYSWAGSYKQSIRSQKGRVLMGRGGGGQEGSPREVQMCKMGRIDGASFTLPTTSSQRRSSLLHMRMEPLPPHSLTSMGPW